MAKAASTEPSVLGPVARTSLRCSFQLPACHPLSSERRLPSVAARSTQRNLDGVLVRPEATPGTVGTFTDNLSLPVHRWFRYPAGFSGDWVERVIGDRECPAHHVLDPFAGTGTTLVAAQRLGVPSIGVEPHPFVSRVADAKLLWTSDPTDFIRGAAAVLRRARPVELRELPSLLQACYPTGTLAELEGIRLAVDEVEAPDKVRRLLWLALVSVLRRCSPVGTAQWQYVLPRRRKASVEPPREAFRRQTDLMAADMRVFRTDVAPGLATLLRQDIRQGPTLPSNWADLVVTSPPYPNNYDYADATRLEMTFLGELREWGDLASQVRPQLIRSCSQHVGTGSFASLLDTAELSPIRNELEEVHSKLLTEREKHGGRKTYHSMVVAYFYDLARAWRAIRLATRAGCRVCFVVGDSAPYGVYVPVERWLGELALSSGFKQYRFEKLRDRNTKWLNRKHRVPLKEGLLWVNG